MDNFTPRPSVSFKLLLQALEEKPQTEYELRRICRDENLFFGVGVGLTGALLLEQYPGLNFDSHNDHENDYSSTRGLSARIKFDPETRTYSLTDAGRELLQQQTNPERRNG